MAEPDPELHQAFITHLQGMIDDLLKERAPYVDGTAHVFRGYKGEMVDITEQQINREIQALERAIVDDKEYWGW